MPGRIAGHDGVGRNISCNHRLTSNDAALPDANTGKNHRIETHPDILFEDYRTRWRDRRKDSPWVARCGLENMTAICDGRARVSGGIGDDAAPREQCIRPDRDLSVANKIRSVQAHKLADVDHSLRTRDNRGPVIKTGRSSNPHGWLALGKEGREAKCRIDVNMGP